MSAEHENVAQPAQNAEEDEDQGVTSIESLCLNCEEQGVTRLLLTHIPFFREVVLMSFSCPHCHYRNTEVQDAASISDKGCKTTLRVDRPEILNRQAIKSSWGRILIPEIELEMPSSTQRGSINTVEGFLTTCSDQLERLQPLRKIQQPEAADKIEAVITEIRAFAAGTKTFTFVLDDPSGTSYIENPSAPQQDEYLSYEYYPQTDEMKVAMGFQAEAPAESAPVEPVANGEQKSAPSGLSQGMSAGVKLSAEVQDQFYRHTKELEAPVEFACECFNCHDTAVTRMCRTHIPNFKEVILMVMECERCEIRDVEVKPGGAIGRFGRRLTLRITKLEDLKRDLLKSESAGISVPELDFEMMPGTLGGKYTTIEGILQDVRKQLEEVNQFALGDNRQGGDQPLPPERSRMQQFLQQFDQMLTCEEPFSLVLDDPLGNVYIYNPYHPDPDPNMSSEFYERSAAQNEDLGLTEMRTEGYDEKTGEYTSNGIDGPATLPTEDQADTVVLVDSVATLPNSHVSHPAQTDQTQVTPSTDGVAADTGGGE